MYSKNKIYFFYIYFLFISFIYSTPSLELRKPITIDQQFLLKTGDFYYSKQQYQNSLLYYLYLNHESNDLKIKTQLKPRILLNYLRLKEEHQKTEESLVKEFLLINFNENNFTEIYIDLYSSFRWGFNSISFAKINRIINNPTFLENQKDYAKLVFGSIYFEENLENVEQYYHKLFEETKSEEVKAITKEILTKTTYFKKHFNEKNPWIAGILSSILPGSGYFYTKHNTDGLFSLFWNSVFLGGGIYMYNLEKEQHKQHFISYGFLIVGLSVYISNIIGSYTSAIRYNNYKLRLFYQELRNIYFNTDFIERTSGIKFEFMY